MIAPQDWLETTAGWVRADTIVRVYIIPDHHHAEVGTVYKVKLVTSPAVSGWNVVHKVHPTRDEAQAGVAWLMAWLSGAAPE